MSCSYVISRGVRKGERCGKVNCKLKAHLNYASGNKIIELPDDVLRVILNQHITEYALRYPNHALKHIVHLSSTCKSFANVIDHDTVWQNVWDIWAQADFVDTTLLKFDRIRALSIKDRVLLLGRIGCLLCNDCPKVRKVYGEFAIRCCETCLHKHTISDYRLKQEYNISYAQLRKYAIPYRSAQLWSQNYGTYDVKFYWITDLERVFSTTLAELQNNKTQPKIHERDLHSSN